MTNACWLVRSVDVMPSSGKKAKKKGDKTDTKGTTCLNLWPVWDSERWKCALVVVKRERERERERERACQMQGRHRQSFNKLQGRYIHACPLHIHTYSHDKWHTYRKQKKFGRPLRVECALYDLACRACAKSVKRTREGRWVCETR